MIRLLDVVCFYDWIISFVESLGLGKVNAYFDFGGFQSGRRIQLCKRVPSSSSLSAGELLIDLYSLTHRFTLLRGML